MGYYLVIIVTLVIGGAATAYVNSQLKKYSKVPSSSGITGAQAAELMLRNQGVSGVKVYCGKEGQDHFDPRSNTISLSPSVYNYASVTAYATACHEVGHACQFAEGYAPLKVRSAIVPAVNLASNGWVFVLIAGIVLNSLGLVNLAIVLYAVVVLFQIVTLPVEFNASHRAMDYMKSIGLPQGEVAGSFSVLRACALTYVAAALASVLQLVWLLSQRD
jgi:hypothetical protein